MKITTSDDLGKKICEVLGIEAQLVGGLTLHLQPNSSMRLDIEAYAPERLVEAIDWDKFVKGATIDIYTKKP